MKGVKNRKNQELKEIKFNQHTFRKKDNYNNPLIVFINILLILLNIFKHVNIP